MQTSDCLSFVSCSPCSVVENYVKWQLALPYIPLLSTPFRRLADAFYEDIGGEGGSPDCVSVTQNGLPFVVSRLYTAKDVIPNTRDKVSTCLQLYSPLVHMYI